MNILCEPVGRWMPELVGLVHPVCEVPSRDGLRKRLVSHQVNSSSLPQIHVFCKPLRPETRTLKATVVVSPLGGLYGNHLALAFQLIAFHSFGLAEAKKGLTCACPHFASKLSLFREEVVAVAFFPMQHNYATPQLCIPLCCPLVGG